MLRYQDALAIAGVPSKQWDDCMVWALGEDFGHMRIELSDEGWNERHGDLFQLKGSDDLFDSTVKIGKAFLEHGVGELRIGQTNG